MFTSLRVRNLARLCLSHRTMHRFVLLLTIGLCLLCGENVYALQSSVNISQLAHTSWRLRDNGLMRMPMAIAQTPDGYIWIGTDAGLLRFDGIRFEPWVPAGDKRFQFPYVRRLYV